VFAEIAKEMGEPLSTVAPGLIERYWEQDVIDQMIMKDILCVVMWVQQDMEGEAPDEAAEAFLNRFDTDNVAVFRISSLDLVDRLQLFEKRLSGAKFDSRIRLVVNVKDPVPVVKQVLSIPSLRHVPVLADMSGVDSPEDSIYELGRLKSDIQFSTKPSDFDKYCAFATVLWINYKPDPNRTISEKRVSKTGVVIQKTDSMEKGLRYMDAHGHLAYLNEFRIIIGHGTLTLDETSEAVANASKKRDFFAQRNVAARGFRGAKGKVASEEEFSTLELVQVIRNRQKWHTPILVYPYDSSTPTDPALYAFKNLKSAADAETLEYFATMKALPWAVELSAMRTENSAQLPGHLRIVNLRCNGLHARKSNTATVDPYVVVRVGDSFEKKTKKLSSTNNPTWNLGWDIPCKLSDRISFQVIGKAMFGKNEMECGYEGPISDLISVATPLVEVTKVLDNRTTSKTSSSSASHSTSTPSSSSTSTSTSSQSLAFSRDKDSTAAGSNSSASTPSANTSAGNSPGTITIEVGFRFEGQREQTLGRLFGQPIEQTIDDTIRNAVPHIIESAICAITLKGLECEGIFRQPTNQKRVDALKEAFDKGTPPADLNNEDPFDVAFLLRTYLKELPQPLIPRAKYEAFKACNLIDKRRDRLVALSDVLGQLPPRNLEAFANIVHLLSDIAKNETVNKMPARNLAAALGPALVIPRDVEADPSQYLTDTTSVAATLETCITYCHKLFQRSTVKDHKKSSSSSIRTFIDPYLTDSLSSPRGPSSQPKGQERVLSDGSSRTRYPKDVLNTDFQLDAKLLSKYTEEHADPDAHGEEMDEEDGEVLTEDEDEHVEEAEMQPQAHANPQPPSDETDSGDDEEP